MELKVFKDTIASYGGRWETRLELPVETEILIPDYLPAVFKIVKCLITPVVLQNRVSGGRWQSEGYLRCRNTATAAPSVSTASTCAVRTSSAPQ